MKKFFLNIWQALKNIKYIDFLDYWVFYVMIYSLGQYALFHFNIISSKSTNDSIYHMAEGFALIMATRAEYKKIVKTDNEEVSE